MGKIYIMNHLYGNSTCKLDDKYRLSLPAKLLQQVKDLPEKDWFIMKPSLELPCIELYPKVNWEEVQQELKQYNRFKSETQRYLLLFMRNHQLVKLDKSKRLLIPQHLLEFAKIEKEVVLAPIIDMIQIWDENTYKLYTEKLPDNYYSLTNTVLNKNNG